VKDQLDGLETHLDDIYREWTQTLLDNLKVPTVEENISLLDGEEQQTIRQFIREKRLPYIVDSRFVRSVSNALRLRILSHKKHAESRWTKYELY